LAFYKELAGKLRVYGIDTIKDKIVEAAKTQEIPTFNYEIDINGDSYMIIFKNNPKTLTSGQRNAFGQIFINVCKIEEEYDEITKLAKIYKLDWDKDVYDYIS